MAFSQLRRGNVIKLQDLGRIMKSIVKKLELILS